MKQKDKKAVVENTTEPIPKKKKVNGRTKGHTWERDLVLIFKSLGFQHCKTTRYANRMLDDCKVDLSGIPLNIQAKVGYHSNRPKFDIIFLEMAAHLESNFPPSDPQRNYPKVLMHKLDGYKDENFGVTMMYKEWIQLYKDSLELKKLKENGAK